MALVEPFPNLDALVAALTEVIVNESISNTMIRGRFTLALPGGTTPQPLYRHLASPEQRTRIAWAKVHVFFTDERCVPPGDQASNYRLVRELLLDHVPIPPEQVHRMRGEDEPKAAAAAYEKELRGVIGPLKGREFGVLDLALLGLGSDGHIASLFGGKKALHDLERWAISEYIDEARGTRITMSPWLLNNARSTIVMVSGEDKARALMAVLEGPEVPDALPAQRIAYGANYVRWMIDAAAGKMLGSAFTR